MVLRQASEGCLPGHIIYQTKRFFAWGSGVAYIMWVEADKRISLQEPEAFNQTNGNTSYLSYVEELYYYRTFKETMPRPAYDRLAGRWDPVRPDFFLWKNRT